MRKTFLLTALMFVLVWTFSILDHLGSKRSGLADEGRSFVWNSFEERVVVDNQAVSAQVAEIDRQIQELEDMKRGYEGRARRHEDQAERLQFQDQAYLETRRHLELADENRAKAAKAQQEIDRLQKEKQKLLS